MSRRVFAAGILGGTLLSALPRSTVFAGADGLPHNPVITPLELIIGVCAPMLVATILVEGIVLSIAGRIVHKLVGRLWLVWALVNLITLPLLSGALVLLSGTQFEGVLAIIVLEILIWLFEAACLKLFPGTRLNWKEGIFFSLGMNLASFLGGLALSGLA